MALLANGTNYLSSGTLPTTATGNFTLMCWAFIETTSEQGNFFCIGREGGGTNNGYEFGVGNNSADPSLGNNGNDLAISYNGVGRQGVNQTISIGTGWHHCAFTEKNTENKWYVDSILKYTGSGGTPSTPTLGWAVGSRLNTSISTADHILSSGNKIAHIKVFNKVLSQNEIITEMNSYRPMNIENLAVWLPVDEGTGTNVSDFSKKYTSALTPPSTMLAWTSGPPISHD